MYFPGNAVCLFLTVCCFVLVVLCFVNIVYFGFALRGLVDLLACVVVCNSVA